MTRTLIGKGTTNSSGIAAMTEDAEGNPVNGYTGTGAGSVDFVAETTVDESTVVSQPVEVGDYLVYDKATTGEKSSDWTNPDNVTIATTDTETTLKDAVGGYKSTKALTGDFQLDVELKSVGNFRFYIVNAGNTVYSQKFLNQNDWGYWRVIRQGSTLTLQYSSNGVTYTNQNWTDNNIGSTDCYFQLNVLVDDRSISYRNLKAYHI